MAQHTSLQLQRGAILGKLIFILLIGCLVAFGFYAYALNAIIVNKFEHRHWDIPARVYSRPLTFTNNAPISQDDTKKWLELLNYNNSTLDTSGTYTEENNTLTIHTRGFDYGDGDKDNPKIIRLSFANNKINRIQSNESNPTVRLEPIEIGSIYPDSNEDREFIALADTPQSLIDALIATEDRGFYEHHGVSIRGTARAILNNFKGGSMQGGSTLTQQLIKNFYLTSERSLKRKLNEAVMAVLLERNYSKDDILQVYLNEIYLGQNGNQSINGFGVASRFYYNKPLNELRLDQQAMLVGLAKGASYYNPRKHPERALERRNVVLKNMLTTGKINKEDYNTALAHPLDVTETTHIAKPPFPDFFDYTRRELNARYQSDDLKTAGLRILTTLDPLAQENADKAMANRLPKLGKNLQGALVSANPHTGEVLALVGSGKDFTGFNRAIDAKRQVGSLLKPIIYLTALQSGKYNLASGVLDEPATYHNWTPKNYGGKSHGVVPLTTALANSYNQAAVNLGMELNLKNFTGYLKHLGINDEIKEYPASLLGAVELSPIQMLGVYQVIAGGGTYHNLHSISRVIDEHGQVLQKTQISDNQRIPADANYLLHEALTHVIKDGTAKAALSLGDLNLGGKTGTTNDAKDAWFAGYSGNYVSVVWIGRDDNKPIGLTGGSGALPIWIDYMKKLHLTPVHFAKPNNIQMAWVEQGTGRASDESCETAVYIPIKKGSVSSGESECSLLKKEMATPEGDYIEENNTEEPTEEAPIESTKEATESTKETETL